MSQVLEKPILLDETGQDISSKINGVGGKLDTNGAAIVSKLNDIKEAIGTSGEFIPLMIKVITPPTKTTYAAGERLDLMGLVVNLIASNGVQIDVTSACTFSPVNGAVLSDANTSVTISYYYAETDYTFTTSQNITVKSLLSIAVTTSPTKTAYIEGDALDLTGMVVTATYSNGDTANVTSSCAYSPANGATLTSANTSVSISYTEGGTTKTTSQNISVKALSSIAITTPPTQVDYTKGDALDLTGMVVTATYDDSSTADVTSLCTFSPANGATLNTSNTTITASYTAGTTTKTATQAITVLPPIYGVEWEGLYNPSFARTGAAADFTDPNPYYVGMTGTPSSLFDNIMPWSGMVSVTDATAGELVAIPKFWYRLTQDGAKIKIEITNEEMTGFHVSPAHMDRGDGQGERDTIYIGKYHCAVQGLKSEEASFPRQASATNSAYYLMRESVHNFGAEYWLYDYNAWFTILILYLVEFANWDSQLKIGYGGRDRSDSSYLAQQYDLNHINVDYHTGTPASAREEFGYNVQYRNIVGLWDNIGTFIDGAMYFGNNLQIAIDPAKYYMSGGTKRDSFVPVGLPKNCYDGVPTALQVNDTSGVFPLFYPSPSASTESSRWGYTCDVWAAANSGYTSGQIICSGLHGEYTSSSITNKSVRFNNGITAQVLGGDTDNLMGYRIMKLPANS